MYTLLDQALQCATFDLTTAVQLSAKKPQTLKGQLTRRASGALIPSLTSGPGGRHTQLLEDERERGL